MRYFDVSRLKTIEDLLCLQATSRGNFESLLAFYQKKKKKKTGPLGRNFFNISECVRRELCMDLDTSIAKIVW